MFPRIEIRSFLNSFLGNRIAKSKPRVAALNFAPWKRDIFKKALKDFDVLFIALKNGDEGIAKAHRNRQIDAMIVWGYPNQSWIEDTASRLKIPIWRVEDGFLRSIGLGANQVAPFSYCIDRTGIYFDPRSPSDLENTLLSYDFESEPELMDRARSLIDRIISQGISKYNGMNYENIAISSPYVLVLGQCEDDASIRLGASSEWTNRALAELAICENPRMPILFRPHPDVAAGRRRRLSNPEGLAPALKVIPGDIALGPVLAGAAKVYTITSLAGFEAVLRGIPTVVTGMPFYAGWGVTDDRSTCARRKRKLKPEQIFAAAYLLYTHYFDPATGARLSAEDVAERLAEAQRLLPPLPADAGSNPLVQAVVSPASLKPEGCEAFDCMGAAWAEPGAAESIVFWGFAGTMRQAMEAYFPGRRLLFVPDNTPFPDLAAGLTALVDSGVPVRFVFWGRSAPSEALAFAEAHAVQWSCAEDGFIRSSAPGNHRARPLSLVFDNAGSGGDTASPSGLERLLEETDFAADPALMRTAGALIGLFRSLGISGYSAATLREAYAWLGARTRRRVLVLGQMEDDTARHPGLEGASHPGADDEAHPSQDDASQPDHGDASCPDHGEAWSNLRALELARAENPEAELIYRPHPQMLSRMRADPALAAAYSAISLVAPADVALNSLLREVDHVYTVSSLSGLEALIHGLPVTVLGAPFYAGWGLTDDRAVLARSGRRLTLEELFAGVYVLRPHYLPALDDAVTGCLATMMTVVAERERKAMSAASRVLRRGVAGQLLAGPHWPAALRPGEFNALNGALGKKLSSVFDVTRVVRLCQEKDYQVALGLLLAGRLAGTPSGDRVLRQVLRSARPDAVDAMLPLLWAMRPSPALAQEWAAHRERTGHIDAAREVFALLSDDPKALAIKPQFQPVSAKRYAATLALAQFELRQRRLGKARELFHILLLSGYMTGEVMEGLSDIAGLSFQFRAAAEIISIFNRIEPTWKDGRGWWLEAKARLLAHQPVEAMRTLSLAVTASDAYIEGVGGIEEALRDALGPLPFAQAALAVSEAEAEGDRSSSNPLARARALIAREQPQRAELVLHSVKPKMQDVVRHAILLSQSMSYQGRLKDAKRLIANMLRTHPTLLLYQEGVRVAIIANDYQWAKELLDAADAAEIELGDMYRRKVLLGIGEIHEGYLSFRSMARRRTLSVYLGKRHLDSLQQAAERGGSVLIVANFGPGDELRFASLYRQMRAVCPDQEVAFTCDPRLHALFSRSYPDLVFKPVARTRALSVRMDVQRYNMLPGADLHAYFDNAGWAAASAADNVVIVTDALGDVVRDRSSFTGTPYLRPDPDRTRSIRQRLLGMATAPLVGLTWRSSLRSHARNEHYLAAEEIARLGAVAGVQFVNLQSDECDDELALLNRAFTNPIIHLSDLDQYNDLDGAAAVMSSLDLVIAPATTVVELAGALGRPTLLLSNSSELHWRKREDGSDLWHRSVRHVEGSTLGNKLSLAAAAGAAIRAAVAMRDDARGSRSA